MTQKPRLEQAPIGEGFGREDILAILQRRDGVTREEAEMTLEECRDRVQEYFAGEEEDDPEDILMEELGLEPDYLLGVLE